MLGQPTAYLTRLPKNDIAMCAVAALRKFGVDTQYIAYGGDRIGVLYLEKGASQRPSKVIYDRKHTAICEAKPSDFDFDKIFSEAAWLHFTGITLALSESTPELCYAACKSAKENGVPVSCDLNYRSNMWSTKQANATVTKMLPYVDVLIANEEDAEKVLGIKAADTDVVTGKLNREGYIDVARQISNTYNIPYVAITLRKSITASDNEWSAMIYHNGKAFFSKEYKIHIVNRVGGGDSFAAGLIYSLVKGLDPQSAVEFAVAASCLKHTIEDDFNLVTVEEVERLMKGDTTGRVKR